QAEDGIRYFHVTGVQTCALPICFRRGDRMLVIGAYRPTVPAERGGVAPAWSARGGIEGPAGAALFLVPEGGSEMIYVQGDDPERSEERRVGEECRSGGCAAHRAA